MTRSWMPAYGTRPDARLRVLLLPYAGGSVGAYHRWLPLFPADVEVCPVELPGHGRRLAETPHTRLWPLTVELADAVLNGHRPLPLVVFGHSMGGLVGYRLAIELVRRGAPPRLLAVSGCAAPHRPRRRPDLHRAPESAVLDELRELGGTPPELLANAELMALMLPTVRADFAVLETYKHTADDRLGVTTLVYGGDRDLSVPLEDLHAWSGVIDGSVTTRVLTGDHFFVTAHAARIAGDILAASATLDPLDAR